MAAAAGKQAGQNILGVMINQWRIIARRPLRDVAAEIGIGHATLTRIEKGESFDADTWLKLQIWMFKRNGNEAVHDPQVATRPDSLYGRD